MTTRPPAASLINDLAPLRPGRQLHDHLLVALTGPSSFARGQAGALDRAAWIVLGVVSVISAGLLLWLNRGTTFFIDELVWFSDLSTYSDLTSVLVPHNSHLHGTTRSAYWLVMEIFGTHYTIFRGLGVASVVLGSVVLFVYGKRRIGAPAALAPTILLLFFGSAWQHVVDPIGFTVIFSVSAGVAALIALDRRDRRGDAIACGLICLSVFTFSTGLPYVVGAAISVLSQPDRRRRAWIFLMPLLLYTAWWLWARHYGQGRTTLDNIDNIVPFFALSLAVVTGALTGVNVPFSRFGDSPAPIAEAPPSSLGWIVAAAFVAALGWRLVRGRVPNSLYVSVGILVTYWLAGALSDPEFFNTQAETVRYVYPGSMAVLLVGIDIVAGLRIPRGAWIGATCVVVFSLAMNLVFLRDGAGHLRDVSTTTKADLAALELAATSLAERGPTASPAALAPAPALQGFGFDPDEYLASVAMYGSPAYDLEGLTGQSPDVRRQVDAGLIGTYGVTITTSPRPADPRRCEQADASLGPIELPLGGAELRPRGPEPAQLDLARFSDPPGVAIGTLAGSSWSSVTIPPDAAPESWKAIVPGGGALTICSLE